MRPDFRSTDRLLIRLEIACGLGLGVWAGAIGMTALAAAIAFPAMRELDPQVSGHPGASGDHWLIVVGHFVAPLFATLGWVQLGCLVVAGGAMIIVAVVEPAMRRQRIGRLRLLVIGVCALLAGYYAGSLEPRMSRELEATWSAARAGRMDDVNLHRERFNKDHPLAGLLLGITLALTAASMGLALIQPARASAARKAADP